MKVLFSENLKYLRKSYNLSQSKLAKNLSINRNKIASYENKIAEPKLSLIPIIAAFFDVSVEQILYSKLEEEGLDSHANAFQTHFNKDQKNLIKKFIKTHNDAEAVFKGLVAMHEFDPEFISSEDYHSRLKLITERLLHNNTTLIDILEQ